MMTASSLRSVLGSRFMVLAGALFITVAASFFFAATAFAAVPTITDADTADTNNNGTIDQIVITFSELVDIDDGAAGDGLTSIALSAGCTIPNADYNNNSTTTLTISSLTGCTAGDTSITPTVTYTAVADCTTAMSICDAAGANQMANGEVETSDDSAGPIITAALISRTAAGGITYNSIRLTYSEDIQVSGNGGGAFVTTDVASSATLSAMTTAKLLDGIASFDGASDMVVSAATNNTVTVDNNSSYVTVTFNTAAAGYFSAGSTAPTTGANFTAVSDVNDLKDLAGNAANASGAAIAATVGTAWDVTAPTISTTYSCDADTDGDVERFQINFSESVVDAGLAAASFEGDNDATNDGTGEETANTLNTATAGCDGSSSDTDANDEKIRVDLTAGIAGTDTAYLSIPAASGRDHAGNRFVAVAGGGTETDKALPLLTTASPTHGATFVPRTGDVILTFTEPIASLTFTISPAATLVRTTTLPATAVTLVGGKASGTNTLTVATAPDSSSNAFGGGRTGGVTHPVVFTVASATSTTPSTSITHSITVTAPATGASLSADTTTDITWSSSSTFSFVNLYYSSDAGVNWNSIAAGTTNDGSYSWTLPVSLEGKSLLVKAEGTDLVTVAASDVSDSVTVSGEVAEDDEDEEEMPEPTPIPNTACEDLMLGAGDLVRGDTLNVVYHIDTACVRHPFYDEQTFFTWFNDFDDVEMIDDADLADITLGGPMLPNPAAVLVKIQSVAAVYALETDAEGTVWLRHITSESVARELFGSSWADYVIDISPAIFPRFEVGDDIDSADDYDASDDMMRRVDLHS